MTYSYKYSGSYDNALQFGVYFEETVTTTVNNQIQCSYPPATEIRDEFLIIDPDGNTDDYKGIIGLWNTSSDPDTNLFGRINGVTKAGVITVSYGAAIGTDVLIKYYVAPQTYSNPFPPVNTTSGNAVNATKYIFQCLLNKCQFMSPINLFRLGYRYANVLCRITLDASDSPWNGSSFVKVFDTNDDSYYDYIVSADYYFPMVIEELRVYSETTKIDVKPSVERGGDNSDDYIGEGGNNYFGMDSNISVYESGASGNYLLSVPLGPVISNSFQVKGRGDGTSLTGDIVIEISGYYMPLSGFGVI